MKRPQASACFANRAEELGKRSRHFHRGPLVAHADWVTLASIKMLPDRSPEE